MMDQLKVQYWIGGYYVNNKVYLQPVDVLIKKNMLDKIIFTEYAHYFINDLTGNNCPPWLNEMLSYYFFMQANNLEIKSSGKLKAVKSFSELIKINKIFMDNKFSKSFYYYSALFVFYLNSKYKKDFFEAVLLKIKQGKSLDYAVLEITGRKLDYIYDKEFINSL